jgi:hypothetical protein
VDKVGPQATELAETRRAAFAKALDDYKTSIEKARADFKETVVTSATSNP